MGKTLFCSSTIMPRLTRCLCKICRTSDNPQGELLRRKEYQAHLRAERSHHAEGGNKGSGSPHQDLPRSKLRQLLGLQKRLKCIEAAFRKPCNIQFLAQDGGQPRLDPNAKENAPLLQYQAQLLCIHRTIRAFPCGHNKILAQVHRDLVGQMTKAEMDVQRHVVRLSKKGQEKVEGARVVDCCKWTLSLCPV